MISCSLAGGDKRSKGAVAQHQPDEGKCSLLTSGDYSSGLYNKPLSCFGCGIGWLSFIMGFTFPLLWYYATFLYLGNLKD
ncbi:hypothetical protein BVC80_441g17 [Macleaya cordata]|uniref:Uncharacterized protein n=1 Tax=Macleaya cordata TaxID=56857 RepID=A0A200Q486_MACCD|nr:hypothetical protein BVC80_441g17 [Macleaya cordata]